MYQKTIICLANSRKPPTGRCVAGKTSVDGVAQEWVRPVSDRNSREVSEEERRYEHGGGAQLLDVIRVPLIRPSPFDHQVENHILDPKYYWAKVRVAGWGEVIESVDVYDQLFWSNSQNTYHGLNDKIAQAAVTNVGSSLKLILVDGVRICVQNEDGYAGAPARRRLRAKFTYERVEYWLSVTDPEIEAFYLAQPNGEYSLTRAALCISLVEVWNGFAFRVVASVITPERCALQL